MISELWLRTAVVTAGTTAAIVLASAALALFPLGQDERAVSPSQVMEAGLVYLPPSPASAARARPAPKVTPQAPPLPPPPPPDPVPSISPEPAPLAQTESPPPAAHEQVQLEPPAPVTNGPRREAEPSEEPNRREAVGRTGAAGALYKPIPVFPPELRLHALDLVAVVRFTIAADGKPIVVLEESTPDLQINQILLDTFRRWRFFPAMQDGKPVPSTLVLRVPIKVE